MPFPDLFLSLSQLFPPAHCHLHAPEYPLLHLYLPLPCDLVIPCPLFLLLVQLPPPHAEVPVAHVLLDDRRVPLRLLGHHLAHRLEHLPEAEGTHERLPRALALPLLPRKEGQGFEGTLKEVVTLVSKQLEMEGFLKVRVF
jgi:hypothetical protein